MIIEIPVSAKKTQEDQPLSNTWTEDHLDIDTRNLIDSHVGRADPSQVKIRGKCFTEQDKLKIRGAIKKIVDSQMIPFIRQKVRDLDESIGNTRKGFKNSISMFFKKPERGENDGLKETFRMNKSDLELRNLCDLAFVMQDYETAN